MVPIQTIIIFGLISGILYALLAMGFTLIYGVAELVNMAHGAFFMLGAYIFFSFLTLLGFDSITNPDTILLPPAIILATIVVGIIGVVIYRFLIHPVEEEILSSMVVTVFIAMVIQQIIYLPSPYGFGGKHYDVPSGVAGSIEILGVTVTYSKIIAVIVSLILFAILSIFIAKAKVGTAMRAVAQDREVAMLMGINTTKLYILTMTIASSLAALAGVFVVASGSGTAEPHMWLTPLGMSFAIVILGGIGSVKGTLVASLIVGFAEQAVALSIPSGSYLRGAVALAIMVTVLLIRPRGLFGKRIELEE